MLSDRLHKLLYVCCHYGSKMGIAPVTFSKERLRAELNPKFLPRSQANCIVLFCCFPFVVFQLMRYYIQNNSDGFNIVLLHLIALILILELYFITSYRSADMLMLINAILDFMNLMQSKNIKV